MVLAPLAGLALVLLEIELPTWVMASAHLIGSATSGLAVFSAGLTLAAHRVEVSRTVAGLTAVKLLIVPAATLLAGRMLGVHGASLAEAVVLSTLSPGLIGLILASRFRIGEASAGSTVILSAIEMAATLPLWILLLHRVT